MMALASDQLCEALLFCAKQLSKTIDPWWVIGSTAIALHGIDPGRINDIDILISSRDAGSIQRDLALPNLANCDSKRFRSSVLLRQNFVGTAVEMMADLSVNSHGSWHPIAPETRQVITCKGARVFVPELTELIEVLRLFARPKDFRRIRMISTHLPKPPRADTYE